MDQKQPTQSTKKPDPSRFEMYTVLPDQTGFKILGSEHIFHFDTYGGWFDEYGNYFDKDANVCTPPNYSEEDDYEEDEADKLARDYEDGGDDGHDDNLEHYTSIYINTENKQVLATYPKGQDVQIRVSNIKYDATEDDFEKFLVENKVEWIEFEFELNTSEKFTGIAYATLDKANAEKLVELNGHSYSGRDIKIVVLKPEHIESDKGEEEEHEEEHEQEHEPEGNKEEEQA